MIRLHFLYLLLMGVLLIHACKPKKEKLVDAKQVGTESLYYGQKPPGLVPEKLPDEFTTENWKLAGMFEPGMEEFYFTTSEENPFEPHVIVFRKENRVWKKYDFYTSFSGDENTLYSKSNYIERTAAGWSTMKSLGPMFDREDWGIMRLTASANGTLVFDDWKNNDVIRISRVKEGNRETPELLGKEINVGKWTAHPFLAPDESYLIWDSEREEGYGDSDLYISFRQSDDSWGAAINMGNQVNTSFHENAVRLTPDGKYFTFGRHEEIVKSDGTSDWVGGRYWVSTQVIENLKPQG
ncbi:MAG: hypothetical protein R8G66_22825 [Cytophagales bacterium]|nr:hypothetical protein [Cytophagales bacterium]